ncbi:MAG: hypothetical protein DRJ37_00845 [Thermoprotei archaeon]|nr:MAG: hypothetical protein DRJ37_00845 [Thermoprotei archaeon]
MLGRRAKPALAAFTASLSWALGVALIKYLSASFTIVQQNFSRYLMAAFFLFALYSYFRREIPLSSERLVRALGPAFLVFLFQTPATTGIYLTKASTVAFLLRLNVVFLAVLAFIIYEDERRIIKDPLFLLGLLLGMVGVGGLTFKSGFDLNLIDLGAFLAGLSALMWALFILSIKYFLKEEDALAYSSIVYLEAGLMFMPFLVIEIPNSGFISPSPLELIILLFSGVISIGIGNWMNMVAVKNLGAMIPSMIQMLTPFLAAFFSYLLLGENMTVIEAFFGVLIVIGSGCSLKFILRE